MKHEQIRAAVLRRSVFSAAVVLLFLFFLCGQLNFYLAESLKNGVYLFVPPVLIAGALYFCRPRGRTEYRLLLLYMLWILVTRALNGDPTLSRSYRFVLDLALMLPFLLLGLTLDRAGRRRVLNWLSVLLGLYFFALGALCVFAFLRRTSFYNPVTGGVLAGVSSTTYFARANILDTSPNATAYWFFMPLSLMLYQFFAVRHKIWRIPIVLSALLDWLVICLTFCRSIRLACALSFALLAAILIGRALAERGTALRILAVCAAFLLVLGLSYKACAWAAGGVGLLSRETESPTAAAEAAPSETAQRPAVTAVTLSARHLSAEAESAVYSDPREEASGLDSISSERLTVYRAVWQTLREHPRMLLFGCDPDAGMALVNAKLPKSVVHCHNFLLQTLLLAGLPGFLLILAFCVYLLAAAIRLLFSEAPLTAKLLALPVLSSLLFGQFEAGFFNYTDARTLFFYLLCGLLLGTYYDGFSPKRNAEN